MSDSQATHTIINQSRVFSTDGPVKFIETEVIKMADSTWAFNITNYHFGRVFSKECKGVFSNKSEAEGAKRDFIVVQRETEGPDFYIE